MKSFFKKNKFSYALWSLHFALLVKSQIRGSTSITNKKTQELSKKHTENTDFKLVMLFGPLILLCSYAH
jgi:hypothetical protein